MCFASLPAAFRRSAFGVRCLVLSLFILGLIGGTPWIDRAHPCEGVRLVLEAKPVDSGDKDRSADPHQPALFVLDSTAADDPVAVDWTEYRPIASTVKPETAFRLRAPPARHQSLPCC